MFSSNGSNAASGPSVPLGLDSTRISYQPPGIQLLKQNRSLTERDDYAVIAEDGSILLTSERESGSAGFKRDVMDSTGAVLFKTEIVKVKALGSVYINSPNGDQLVEIKRTFGLKVKLVVKFQNIDDQPIELVVKSRSSHDDELELVWDKQVIAKTERQPFDMAEYKRTGLSARWKVDIPANVDTQLTCTIFMLVNEYLSQCSQQGAGSMVSSALMGVVWG